MVNHMKKHIASAFFSLALFAGPAETAAENDRLTAEINRLQKEWATSADEVKTLQNEEANFTAVIRQKKELLAAIQRGDETAPPPPKAPAPEARPILKQNFGADFKIRPRDAAFAQIKTQEDGRPALVIELREENTAVNPIITLPLDAKEIAGQKLRLTIQVKADNISRPAKGHQGGRVGFRYSTDGKPSYPAAPIGGGSFDWKTVELITEFPAASAGHQIMLGLQGVTGQIAFRNLQLEALR